jgi:hypothetical protein
MLGCLAGLIPRDPGDGGNASRLDQASLGGVVGEGVRSSEKQIWFRGDFALLVLP